MESQPGAYYSGGLEQRQFVANRTHCYECYQVRRQDSSYLMHIRVLWWAGLETIHLGIEFLFTDVPPIPHP